MTNNREPGGSRLRAVPPADSAGDHASESRNVRRETVTLFWLALSVAAVSRGWRRHMQKLHRIQCYLHLGLFLVEPGRAGKRGKVVPNITDRFLDLVAATKRHASKRRQKLRREQPLNHYDRAAAEELERFRARFEPIAPTKHHDSGQDRTARSVIRRANKEAQFYAAT